jgi:hypothetical protein
MGGRPNNVSAWKPDDFRKARTDRDPRLLAAITAFGPARASSENAARLLVDLVQTPAGAIPADASAPAAAPAGADPGAGVGQAVGAAPPGMAAMPPPPEDAVVAAIIDALGSNRTAVARDALKKLLTGELRTATFDAKVTGLAAKAILKKPSEKEEQMLLLAATNPALLRKGTADPALQTEILAAIDVGASADMRRSLVDFAMRKGVTAEHRKAVIDAVLKPEPTNLPAQARLFHGGKIDKSTKADLDQKFTTFSTAVIDRLLGLKNEALPATAPSAQTAAAGTSAEANLLQTIVDSVWSEDVVAQLSADAQLADHLADFAQPLMLAVSIPVTSMRTAIGKLAHEHWADGPEEVNLGGRFGDAIHDPGLLLVAKRIRRKDEPPERKPRTRRAAERLKQREQWGNPGKEPTHAEKEEKATYAWMKATEEFVQSLNSRFFEAAKNGAGQRHLIPRHAGASAKASKPSAVSTAATASPRQAAQATTGSPAGQFPLELHEGAKVLAEFHLCWPDDLPKRLRASNISPLAVHYVRMEESASMMKLNTHYTKQLRGATSRPRSFGRWIDWTGQGVALGQARTVDVLFERREKPASDDDEDEEAKRPAADEPEPLTIEILVVEIPEYRVAPSEEEESTKAGKSKKSGL